ncbi:DWNN-domain-containing protein [Athelia psychrophila]|uniref:DWNN-domain-containing protein n=1 Tax=Athelia psychrophila TaxID=1759441 RepID=A0A166NZM4_9AGAM|nr:DWNN-domain-containing protein [Fibularhizoctonia sp. CBS 109695]
MASSVFYKFRSQRDESRVTFDGTGISVFDLKKEIILANNLGKANDFDLFVYDTSSNEEYKDDSSLIPRGTSLIVKRMPAVRPGKGKAAMYIAGVGNSAPTSEPVQRPGSHSAGGGPTWHKGAMSKRFDGKEESPLNKPPTTSAAGSAVTQDDEQAAMAAMFQAQTANWEETQEKMSQLVSRPALLLAQRIYTQPRGTGFTGRGGAAKPHIPQAGNHQQQPDRPLPASYVCYRCGQKGHWIHDCPTNNDREFDNKPRIKRTTGIPRSFLKTVDNPNTGAVTAGVMVTPEGGYVIAQPDSAAWQKQVTRAKGLTAAEVRERTPTDPSLVCPIDSKLFRDAVKTPCCGTHYCEECIQTHLLERDFLCPNCGKKIASLDKVVMDKPTRTKVLEYIEKTVEESKKEAEEENGSANESAAVGEKSNTPDIYGNDQEFYSEQQPGGNVDMSKMIVDSIPQLQASVAQLSVMLQNPSLPNQLRQTTQMQYQELQMQLQQAQNIAATLAMATGFQQQQVQQQQQQQRSQVMNNNFQQQNWNNGFANQQPAGQDSAYQRLPVNNRRHLKRDRPSDFLEVGGSGEAKQPKYWE